MHYFRNSHLHPVRQVHLLSLFHTSEGGTENATTGGPDDKCQGWAFHSSLRASGTGISLSGLHCVLPRAPFLGSVHTTFLSETCSLAPRNHSNSLASERHHACVFKRLTDKLDTLYLYKAFSLGWELKHNHSKQWAQRGLPRRAACVLNLYRWLIISYAERGESNPGRDTGWQSPGGGKAQTTGTTSGTAGCMGEKQGWVRREQLEGAVDTRVYACSAAVGISSPLQQSRGGHIPDWLIRMQISMLIAIASGVGMWLKPSQKELSPGF